MRRLSPRILSNLRAQYAAASPDDRHDGYYWYWFVLQGCKVLADESGHSVSAIAGAVAALSPGRDWEGNWFDVRYTVEWLSKGWVPLVGSYGWRNVAKAHRILSGESPEAVLSGDKVVSFYRAIMSGGMDHQTVVIDRHAKRAAYNTVIPDAEVAVRRRGEYEWLAQHYRRVAREVGITPSMLQATLWVRWKTAGPLTVAEVA